MSEAFRRALEVRLDDVSPGERSVVAVINNAAVDRYRTCILPAGGKLENYRKNPVLLWEHGLDPARGSLPIGRSLWVKFDKGKDRILAKDQFHGDEFSDNVFRLYQAEMLRSFSVHFRPLDDCSPPTSNEVRSRPELAECRMMYRSWELLEHSAVGVPGNAECLAQAVSRGLWVPDSWRKAPPAAAAAPAPTSPALPPLRGRTLGQVVAAAARGAKADALAVARKTARDLEELDRGMV